MHVLYNKGVLIHIQCSNLYGLTCAELADLDSTLVCIHIVWSVALFPGCMGWAMVSQYSLTFVLTSMMMKWDIFGDL